jgi:hypothetical protein
MLLSLLQSSSHATFLIVTGYLVLAGLAGLVWPLLHLGPNHPEFQAQSLAYRLGANSRELAFSIASVAAGIGLFWHYNWARKLALGVLLVQTIYTANALAWGFSGGQPTARVRLVSRIVAAAWNGLWFYLVYRMVL